jgi:hypothetical protein
VDQADVPTNLPNSTPISWSWLSTINRVNSQVQKVRSYDLVPAHILSLTLKFLDASASLCHNPFSETNTSRYPGFPRVPLPLFRERSRPSKVHTGAYARLASHGFYCILHALSGALNRQGESTLKASLESTSVPFADKFQDIGVDEVSGCELLERQVFCSLNRAEARLEVTFRHGPSR